MDNLIGIGSIVLAVVGAVYFGFRLQQMNKLRKDLGDKVIDIFPGKVRKNAVMVMGIALIVLIIVAIIFYAISQMDSYFINLLLLAFVLIAGARYLERFVVMYDKGIIAHMHIIQYHEIKSFDFEELKSKKFLLRLKLQKDIAFSTVVTKGDREAVNSALKKAVK